MAKLTSLQANILANNFLGLAQAIGDFRYENWNNLSKADNQKLGDFQRSILNYGEDILALSTTLVMDDVQTSLAQINNVTAQIKGTIKNLQNIQKGINVAASVVTLGAAIISKNPETVASAISGAVHAWNA
jgi:uncharacterized protein YoxC